MSANSSTALAQSLRRSLWLIGSNGVRLVVSGLYFLLLAALLGPAQYGLYSAIRACGNIASPLANLGQPELLVQQLSRQPQERAWAWGNALTIGLGGGLVLSIALAGVLSLWLPGLDPATALLLLSSDLMVYALQEVQKGMLVAQDRIREVALIDTALVVARCSTVLLALAWQARLLSQWAVLYAGIALLTGVVIHVLLLKQWGAARLAPHRLGEMGRQGWDFALGLMAIKTFADLDKLLLPRLASSPAAGQYGLAYQGVSFALAPAHSLLVSSFLELCRQGKEGLGLGCRYALRILPWVVGYGLVAAAALWLGAAAIPRILGPTYAETVTILRWLSPVVLLEGIHALASNLLAGAGLQRPRGWIQVGALLLNAGLNLWWIPAWGWRGAAAATLASEVGLVAGLSGFIAWRLWRSGSAGKR